MGRICFLCLFFFQKDQCDIMWLFRENQTAGEESKRKLMGADLVNPEVPSRYPSCVEVLLFCGRIWAFPSSPAGRLGLTGVIWHVVVYLHYELYNHALYAVLFRKNPTRADVRDLCVIFTLGITHHRNIAGLNWFWSQVAHWYRHIECHPGTWY